MCYINYLCAMMNSKKVNKCCMSNVKNAVSKQNCNINLNYIKSMRDRFTAICKKYYRHILANYRLQKE